jgi:site-specific recombinase XerC
MRKPKPIPGVEIRERRRRNGQAYYRYRVRYINGAGVRDDEEFDTPQEAKDFKAKLRLAKRSGVLRELSAGKETLGEFMADYWRLYAKRHLAKVTRKKNRGMWNKHILPRLGATQLRQITPMALCEYIAALEDAGVSASQIRSILGMLQSMFARAIEWGRATINPVKQIKKPAAPRQRAIQPLAPEVIERIRAAMLKADPVRGLRDATIVSLGGYTGMRPEEILALEVTHVRQATVLIEQKVSLGEVLSGSYTQKLWMRVKRKAAYLPG